MTINDIAARAAAAGARIGAWAMRRARERSTYAGLAMLAAALGHQALSTHIGQVGDAVALLVGAGLAAATTSQHAPPTERQ